MSQLFAHGYALLIGVTENQVPAWALPDVAKDVMAFSEVLTNAERCAYAKENVKVVIGKDATRQGIFDALEWLEGRLKADTSGNATAVIYYTGHGWRNEATAPPTHYLIPCDMRETAITSRALRAEDFAAEIAALNPKRLLVLLDCCHAGGMGVKDVAPAGGFASTAIPPALLMTGEKAVAAAQGSKGLDSLERGAGRAVLSSSQGTQRSYIRRDGKMSIFTYHVIEALIGHAAPAEGATEVLVSDVMGHVWRRVSMSARADCGADQQPDYQVSGNFPVALLLGGKGLGKGMTAPDPMASLPPSMPIPSAHHINTGGGAFVQGNVNTGGGDFTGRDKIVTTGPVATGGSAISTRNSVAVSGQRNVVITGKVGGNVLVDSQMHGSQARVEDLQKLLDDLRCQVTDLQKRGLSAVDAAEATHELDQAVELAGRDEPPTKRIVRALENVKDIVQAAGSTVASAVALAPLIDHAIQLAQSLFAH